MNVIAKLLRRGGVETHFRRPEVQLAGLAVSSLMIYALAFLWPYSLFRWWRYPQQSISQIAHGRLTAAGGYVLAFTSLFLLYGMAYRAVRGRHSRLMWGVVAAGMVLFNGTMLWLYPVDAADVFDNIMRGRMLAYHGGNPLYETPAQFQVDPFFRYVAWKVHPSAYGPLWELIAAGAARLAGDGVIANVLVFKLVSVAAYVTTTILIGLMLQHSVPERALAGVVLFAWNPLVIYVTAGSGHNDAVMVLFIVLGFYWLMRGRLTLAALAQTAGALTKFIPALLVPVIVVGALRQLQGRWARARYAIATTLTCGLLTVGLYAPFWRGGDVLGVSRRVHLFTTSLPTLIQVTLEPRLGEPMADLLAARAALLALTVWMIWQLRATWRSDDRAAPVRSGLSILLFYLLVSCPWFQAWYAMWPLALAALVSDEGLLAGSVLLSFAATWKMPLFDFVLVRGELPPRAWREWRLTLGTLGVPWSYFAHRHLSNRTAIKGSRPRKALTDRGLKMKKSPARR